MRFHQIYLSDENSDLPPALRSATATVKACFPDAQHYIYDNLTLRSFIEAEYDAEVLDAYDTLQPYSYKADLGRFCLLNRLGGWYADIAVRFAAGGELPGVKFLAFRDIQRFSGTCWACATTILYSQPNNPALERAIAMIVENVRNRWYGLTPLDPTGPGLLGRALAAYGPDADFVYGDYLELTANRQHQNRAFVLPDGKILAWSKPAGGGDLTALGGKGVNNYNDYWHNRTVYGEDR
jgi:mannosyltransferase OCH1-like enzyme